MKSVLKEFLMVLAFCSGFQLNAEKDPILVFDKEDPEVAVGIKLNLPEDFRTRSP